MLEKMRDWQPPDHWLKITTIDCHAAGEPLRVIIGGFPGLPGETIVIESIISTRFSGRVVETTTFGPYPAVIPEVEGTAYITGRHEFLIDPDDPLRDGFILR